MNFLKNLRISKIQIFVLLMLSFVLFQVLQRISTTFYMNIYMNGLFQLANSLQRIGNGNDPGIDFYVFHGTGFAYLHYPIYALFENPIIGALFSRTFSTFAFFLLFSYLAFRMEKRSLNFYIGFLLLVCLLSVFGLAIDSLKGSLPEILSSYLKDMGIFFGKDASQKFFRWAIMAICLLTFHPNFAWKKYQEVAQGLAIGFLLFVTLDYGIASLLAAFLLLLLKRNFRALLILLASFPIGYFLPLMILSGLEGAVQVFLYQFKELPADQFWYFGAYGSATTISTYIKQSFLSRWEPLVWFGSLAIILIQKKERAAFLANNFKVLLLVAPFISGAISSFASLDMSYLVPTGLSLVYLWSSSTSFKAIIEQHYKLLGLGLALITLVASGMLLSEDRTRFEQYGVFAGKVPYDEEYAQYLAETAPLGIDSVVAQSKNFGASFSNYYHIKYNKHHSSGFDLFFHALGKHYEPHLNSIKEETDLYELFRLTPNVGFKFIACRPEVLEILLQRFELININVFSSFWKKSDKSIKVSSVNAALQNNVLQLAKPLDTNEVAFAEVEYSFKKPLGFVPVLPKTCKIGTKQENSFRQQEYTFLNPNVGKGLVIIYPQKDGSAPRVLFEAQKRMHLAQPILQMKRASVKVYTLTPEERKVFFYR